MNITDSQLQNLMDKVNKTNIEAYLTTLAAYTHRFVHPVPTCWNAEVAATIRAMFVSAGVTDVQTTNYPNYDWWGESALLGWGKININNVVASIRGTLDPTKHIVIVSHSDTIASEISFNDPPDAQPYGDDFPQPGVDDNGSGVAAMVEIARAIMSSGLLPDYTIDFVVLGLEEVGDSADEYIDYIESINDEIVVCLNIDMISYPTEVSPNWELRVNYYDTDTGYVFRDAATTLFNGNTTLTPVNVTLNSHSSNSYAFYLRGYAALYFEERERSLYYHSEDDTVINSSPLDYCAEITKGILSCVAEFSRLHSNSVSFTVTGNATVKAKAFKYGVKASETVTATYIIEA